jgi:SAM-dependent methyltransferase
MTDHQHHPGHGHSAHGHSAHGQSAHGHSGHDHSAAPSPAEIAALAELLDLDAEVNAAYLDAVVGWITEQADREPATVLDLGAGTGSGSLALARRLPGASITAIDAEPTYLNRMREHAQTLGLADRITIRQQDLDSDALEFPPADLVWASLSMHHFADPDAVLRAVHTALRPGGLVAVVEMDAPPRYLPDDLGQGRPGLEQRMLDLQQQAHQTDVPNLGIDWAPPLTAAGFTGLERREFALDPARPYSAAVGQYAHSWLQRSAERFADQLDDGDRAVLAALLDGGPADVRTREDLHVRGSRIVWLGRRD